MSTEPFNPLSSPNSDLDSKPFKIKATRRCSPLAVLEGGGWVGGGCIQACPAERCKTRPDETTPEGLARAGRHSDTRTRDFFCAPGWGRFCPAFRCLSQDEEMRTGHPTHPLHGRRLLRCCHGNSSSHQQQQQQQQYGPVMHRPGGSLSRARARTQRKKENTTTHAVFATLTDSQEGPFRFLPGSVR